MISNSRPPVGPSHGPFHETLHLLLVIASTPQASHHTIVYSSSFPSNPRLSGWLSKISKPGTHFPWCMSPPLKPCTRVFQLHFSTLHSSSMPFKSSHLFTIAQMFCHALNDFWKVYLHYYRNLIHTAQKNLFPTAGPLPCSQVISEYVGF